MPIEKDYPCPKCHVPMKVKRYMDRNIGVCSQCEASLISQKDISYVLGKLYDFLKQNIDFKGKVEAIPDKLQRIHCPECHQEMDQHGYMESRQVIIDVCKDCGFIFVDKGELGVMALLAGQLKELNKTIEFEHRYAPDILSIGVLNSWILY